MEFSNFATSTPAFQPTLDETDLVEDDSKPDLTRPDSYLLSNDWVNAEPEARSRMAEKASALQTDALMAAKGGTIEMEVYRDGKKTRDQVPIHGPDGLLSQQARQYLDQSRQAMFRAAQDPDGGVMLNGFTNRLEAAPWVSQLASSDPIRSEADPDYARFNEFVSERTALDSEDKLQGLSFNEYKSWANEGETDPAKQVTDDPEMVKKFNRHIKRTTYDPTTMGDSKAVDLVDGELAINPTNFFELDQVEAEIEAQNMPASQKRLALMDYHAKVNERIMDGVRIFSAADAGPFESVVNRPLVNDLAAHLEAGGTGIDFLRANKERMSRDSYGVTSEVVATLRDALIATGTGATWLAGAALDQLPGVSGMGEILSTPAQLWGELGEESAQAYRNPIAFSVGSVDITRRDLTSLTGQIGSFLALGGLGSYATKAVGLTAAKTALVEGTAKASTNFATTLAKLTGGKLGEKTSNFLITSATDGSAYLGGVQAAGMSFGSTHDAILKATGDEKEAYRAASIQGLSDGFGALIATSVMNRVAPGAERLLGVKPGKLAGSLVQRVRAAKANTAGLAGLMETKEVLEKLSPELIKQFSKDMAASMRKTASSAGMRGIGIGGDIVAEFGEEALDEALSDVIGMVIDDSKSWSAGDWGNIHDNFRDYFKAGILGALGGAMGGAKGAVGSGLRALGSDTKRKVEVERVIKGEWDLIKKNVKESFSNRENLTQGHGGKAVKLAEILAAPENEISLKEKSALLVNAARFGKLTSVMASTVPIAPEPSEAAPEEDQEKTTTGAAPSVTGTPKAQQGAVLSPQDVIRQVGQIPANRQVRDDVEVEELASSTKGNVEFVPLKIGSVSHAGAKVVTTDSQGKKQVVYLSAKEAAAQAPTKTLKKAFQATIDLEGKGLTGETYADGWSIKESATVPSAEPQGDAVHFNEAIAKEYEALSVEELFSRAKWKKDPDSLDADNEESFRAQKRAMTEIKIRNLQEQFEQSKKSDDSSQAADNVGTDSQGSSPEPKGDGVGQAADGGIDGQNDGNREAGQGTSESTVPAATAEVATDESTASDPAATPPLKTAMTLQVFKRKLQLAEGLDFAEQDRSPIEQLPSNRENYPGNKDVWMQKKTGKLFFAPGFLQRVLDNPGISDPVAFVKGSVAALNKGEALPELPVAPTSTTLGALPTDTEVQPMPETNLNPRYIVLESELEQETENGTWKRKEDVYFFTPGKGRTLNIAQGEMLELEGSPDSRLFLMSVDNGVWVFKRVELSQLASKWSDGKFEKGVDEFQKEWAQTRLGASAQRMAPLLDKLLSGNLDTGEGSAFRALFHDILRTVAPNADAPAAITLDGTDFLQATASTSGASSSLTMEVDYDKLAKVLARKIGKVDLSDPRIRPLVALEASRILAKWIDEEQIHLITLNEEKFTRNEISRFYYSVVSDSENPFYGILVDTVRERFKDKKATADLDDPDALIDENDVYVAGSEFLRKLHQLRISGATSEMAAQQASLLNRAIKEDMKEGESPKLINVIGELLRRYTQRLRMVLNTRWAISRLPESQRMLLDRLNVEYLSAGLQGDVDMVRKKLLTSAKNRLDLSSSDLEDTLNDVGRKYSSALTKLKELSKEFVNIGLDDFLTFKEGDGLRLHPEVEKFVSDSKDYDLPSIQDALDALTEANSFQLSWMDAYFAREAMEAAELALDFNPSELLDPTRSFDPSGIMATIVKGSPRGDIRENALVKNAEQQLKKLDDQIELAENVLVAAQARDLREADTSTLSGKRQLLKAYKALTGLLPDYLKSDFSNQIESDRSFARLKEEASTYYLALERQRTGELQPLLPEMASNQDWSDLSNLRANRATAFANLTELRGVLTAMDPRETKSTPQALRIKNQLEQASSGVDMDVANQRYRQFKDYLDAVDQYNKRVNFMTQRAIGSFDFDSKDYGLFFQDTQHLPNEERIEPRFGKKTDPSFRAVTPGDTYGHDSVPAAFSSGLGQLPGQSFPKNPPKSLSLEKQEIWKAIKRTIESNAAFLGREARKDFFIADTLQRHKAGFDRDGYNAGAGFVLDYTLDEDTGRKTYETADDAFPSFDGLDVMFSVDRKLEAAEGVDTSKTAKSEFDLNSIFNFISYIEKAERWIKHVKQRAGLDDNIPMDRSQSEFTAEMDGRQTPAARAQILLDPVLLEMEAYVKSLKDSFENTVAKNFYYKADSSKTFLERFDRKEDGKLKIRTDSASAINSFKLMLPSTTSSNFKIAVEATLAAQSAVSLTRRMLKEFNNLSWQENIEREAIRTIRDAAFVPEHSEFLQLRESAFDLVTARNLEFNLNYLATYPGTYWVASAYAYEMLEQHRKVNKGSGLEPYMKMVKARLASGQQVGVVRGSEAINKTPQQLESERQADLWSEFESNEEGLPRQVFASRRPTTVAMQGINPESDVLGINDIGPEGQANNVFSSGETGSDFTAYTTEVVGEGRLTQQNKADLQQDMLNQARIKRLTTWLTLIGYRINSGDGNVEDARNFRGDVLRKGMTGEGDVRDLVERGIKGMFSAVRGQTSIINSLVESFYQENPHWEINSRDYVTAATGTLGQDYGQDPTEGAERVEYETQQGSFDPELFAVELLEFKAQFERKVIEDAKIKNKNQIASALATVLRVGVAGVTNLEIDPKSKDLSTGQRLMLDFKDFAETYKKENNQDLFGLDEKAISHVTPEDSEAVAKLIRRGITQGELGVYDAALITTEDMFLTDNPLLSLLLTNLPSTRLVNGKRVPIQTLIVRPTPNQMSIAQADQIGPRLFPGKDGMPNVVYVPLTDTGRSDAQAMMQQALLIYGENPEMQKQISDLAAKLRRTLSPGFSTDTATMLWNNLGQLDSLREEFQDQVLEMEPKDRVKFDQLLVDHVRRVSASLAESAITEGEVKGTGFGSDVLLVSLVLTDPNYKRAFDQAYIGTDRDMNLGLPESAVTALQTAIQQAAGFGMDREPLTDNAEPDEAVGAFNVMADPKPLIDILDPTRMEPADLFEDTPVTPPSDSLLFNLLGGLLVSAKESNKRLMPPNIDGTIRRNRDANREIYEPRSTRQELDLSQNPLAAPIFGDKNRGAWGDIRNRYVGSILNLTNPGAIGISPISNAMNQVRLSTQTAALLAQMPSLRSDINAEVYRLIGLQDTGKLKEVIRHQIELTDGNIDEISKMLPPQLALELAAERKLLEDGLVALDETLTLNQIRIDQAEAVLAKEPDGSLMLNRWKEKLKKRNKQLQVLRRSAKIGTPAYDQIESERLKIQSLLAKEDLGGLVELSDLEGTAIKEAIADQIFELAANLNDRSAGLYEMEAELVQLSLRKRLELVHSREIQGMRDLMSNMRYLVRQREALMETDPSGQVRKGIVVELEGLVAVFNKKTARLNEAVQANLNSHLDRLGLPPRSGLKPLSIVFGDMNTVTDADLNQIVRRLSPTRIVSQANSKDLLLNSIFDWAGKEFKAGLAEITGIPVNKKVKKDTSENKQANLEALRRFMQSVEGKSKKEILNLIDLMLPSVEEGGESRIDQVLQMLVLSTAEGQTLIDDRTSTKAEVKARLDAQNDILEATRQNNRIRRERELILNNEDTFYVGRYRHVSNQLGPDRKPLSVQVGIELVAEGMLFDKKKKLSRQAQNERNEQIKEWGESILRRRKFYVDKEALRRVLKRHSEDRVDQHYKKLRGQLDNFNTFDPSRMINEAMDRVRIEDAVIKSRFDQAVSDEDKAKSRGVSQEALMMMMEHKKGFYTAPVVDLKNKTAEELRKMQVEDRKVRRAKWQLNPKNIEDRRRLTGTLVNDGIPVVLMAVDARERLLRAFPKSITPQNINRQVNDIVLRALADHDGSGVFMQQTMSVDVKTPFSSKDFTITDGQTLTAKEASKVFSAHFVNKLSGWLNRTRGSDVNLSGENSKRSVEFFSSLVEQLVQVYGNPGLRDRKGRLNTTGEKVKELLDKIDSARFAENNRAIQDLNLIGVYAEAFAELEANSIMKKLVSGLSIHDDFASLTMMKAFHHQDARVRMRFIKDHVARETAVHLQAFLEKGFDSGRSGREGGHVAREAARKNIANKAKELKGNALDQTIGYVLAQLKGLSDNNDMGLSQALGAWIKDFSNSYNDLLQLENAQKARWGGKMGFAQRFLWANHIELIRDIPLASRIIQIMKESGATSQYMAVTYGVKPTQQFNRDENAREVIEALREALLKAASNKKAVEEYGDVIYKSLSDTYNATAVALALMSKPQSQDLTGETDEEGKPTSWKNRSIEPSRRTYTSVPLRMAYASNPNSKKPRKVKEGKWIPDPADTVSITDSAFFGGAGKREENRKKASVFRPLAINGLAAPLAVLDDSLYRLNVAPNYEILRRLTGKVMTQSGIPKVGESMMINSATRNAENDEEDYSDEWNIAMAAIATEIENNIFNDGRIGVVNTGFSETMTFLASTYVVRALSSFQQIWNQALPPVALFVTKKLLTGQYQEASDFLKILSQSISSTVSRGPFHVKLNDFTKRVSPFIHFRGVDGQDVARNELRSQLRYVDPKGNQLIGKAKQLSGKVAKEYENIGEQALNLLIGFVERLVSRAIFAAELMSEIRRRNEGVGPKTVEDLFELNDDQIPVVANEMARIKVSDMMGQSDQSKKSLLFQSQSDSPVWSSLLKSLVRFSNHTATTSSNMTAFIPGLFVEDESNRTRREAAENIIGTIGQNVVFHFAKVQTLVPLLFYVFYLAGGDDDDEAARKAQLAADDWLSSEDDGKLVGFGKDLVFGSQKQLFSDKKTADAAQASAMAMLTSKVGIELTSGVPVIGVMAGYSPISSILARNFINPASEELASAATGVEVANAWYEKTRVGVQEYSGGGLENMADITAPSSVLYDMMAAPKLAYDAYPTANAFDVSLYLMSELIAPARDYRSARRKEMREAAKKEEKKNK